MTAKPVDQFSCGALLGKYSKMCADRDMDECGKKCPVPLIALNDEGATLRLTG